MSLKKTYRLNEIDNLIIDDISKHPGSTQGQVVSRLQMRYRSRTYIQTSINRLVALGYLRDDRTSRAASLFCLPISAC